MRYRVIDGGGSSYIPQYFEEGQGWKLAYASQPYDKCSYNSIEKAKEACKEHALNQRKVVWSDEF